MTRAEAIECIQEDGILLGAGDFVDVEALKVAVACMQEQERNKWISVKDRLPEDGQQVLTHKNGICDVQTYEARRNGWISGCWFWSMATVTHWMPLPTPPKEDAE